MMSKKEKKKSRLADQNPVVWLNGISCALLQTSYRSRVCGTRNGNKRDTTTPAGCWNCYTCAVLHHETLSFNYAFKLRHYIFITTFYNSFSFISFCKTII